MSFDSTSETVNIPDAVEFEKELITAPQFKQKSITSLQSEVDQLKIQLAEAENKLSKSLL